MKGKYLVNSRILYNWGGLNREGRLISNFDSEGEGLTTEDGLIERGGLIEILRYYRMSKKLTWRNILRIRTYH